MGVRDFCGFVKKWLQKSGIPPRGCFCTKNDPKKRGGEYGIKAEGGGS